MIIKCVFKFMWLFLLSKAIHLDSEYGTYSVDIIEMRKPSLYGFPGFPCLIGMSYIDKVLKTIAKL